MKEKLIGGMAIPRGVLFITEERMAAGYYDDAGQLRLYTQPVSMGRLRSAGPLGELILLLFETWRAVWRMEPDRGARNALLTGVVIGLILGFWVRGMGIPPLLLLSISLSFLLLMALTYQPFRQFIGQIRRHHTAEHMVAHALEQTNRRPTLEEARQQPMLHPSCGSNLVMFLLPGFFLPYWAALFLILPALGLFAWANRHPEHPLAQALLSFAYLGQRLVLAPPEDRDLQAALKALEGLEG